MATGVSEVDDAPPLKRRKSTQDAHSHIITPPPPPPPSARTWVPTFNRLIPPFFGVPAFTAPEALTIQQQAVSQQQVVSQQQAISQQQAVVTPQQKAVTPEQSAGFKHVFGSGIKAPVFTFTPHSNQKLFPSFQNALQGPQLPAKQPPATQPPATQPPATPLNDTQPHATPLNDTLNDAARTDNSIAEGTSEKLRKICTFFTKPTPAPAPVPIPSKQLVPTSEAAPQAQRSSAAQSIPAAQTVPPTQSIPSASQQPPTAHSVPTAQNAPPRSKLRIIHASGGLMQYRNVETREVLTVGPSGKTTVYAPAQWSTYQSDTQQAGPSSNTQSARIATRPPLGVVRAAASQAQSVVPASSWRAPPPAHLGMVTRSQSAAKRSHAETMSVEPAGPSYALRHGPRIPRRIATAVAKSHRLSLDNPVFLEAVDVVQDFTEYKFNSHEYIREALHSPRMPVSVGDRICLQGNQRLAMLGDSLLKLAILEERQSRVEYCRDTEIGGSRLWCNASLYRLGRLFGVDDLLWSISGVLGHRRCTTEVIVATAMEAILGAIWLDCGKNLAVIKHVVRLWFGEDLD